MDWQNMILTRDSLLSRLKNLDDQESWRDFFTTYWRLIHNVALKGLSEPEAQDVVQTTVITVAKHIHEFRKGREWGSFKGWLLKTTRWRIADQFRKRRPGDSCNVVPESHTSGTAVIETIPDPGAADALDAVWEREWEQNLMDVAIEATKRQIDPAIYQLFDLHAVQGWPAAKVAQTLGISPTQVYSAKYKVSELIKKQVDKLKKQPI